MGIDKEFYCTTKKCPLNKLCRSKLVEKTYKHKYDFQLLKEGVICYGFNPITKTDYSLIANQSKPNGQ